MVKNIIIGAGPAGLQMAHFLKDEEYLILEKSDTVCSFFEKFPRHGKLISLNKSKNLKFDWNAFIGGPSFREYSEDLYPDTEDYIRYAKDFSKDMNIVFNYTVMHIYKNEGTFYINNGEYTCERLFIGTGLVPRKPDINVHPSFQVFTYENMPLDLEVYRDKAVFILGFGNAALETANFIDSVSERTILCGRNMKAWNTHYPGYARTKHFGAIDNFFLKARTGIIFDQDHVDSFTKSDAYQKVKSFLEEPTEQKGIRKCDIVIFCTGFDCNTGLFKNMIQCEKFPLLTPNFESTIVPDLFVIGAASQQHDYKKGTSSFIHGFRYNCQYISRWLKGIQTETFTHDETRDKILSQINNSSALFHRFDYFCDLVGLRPDGNFDYISEIPIKAVDQFKNPDWKTYFTVKLGYFSPMDEDFNQPTTVHPDQAVDCKFLHPILHTPEVSFHLPEEIFTEFIWENFHVKPLDLFIQYVEGNLQWEDFMNMIYDIPADCGKINVALQ